MGSLIKTAAITGALLFVPLLAVAQEPAVGVQADINATTTKPKPRPGAIVPKLGPAIKNTIEDARAAVKNIASTTREEVKARVDAVQNLIGEHKLDVQAILELKKQGVGSSTPEEREAVRAETRQKIEDKRAELQDRIQAAKQKAAEKFSESVQKNVDNIVNRLTKAVADLGTIADRIDARINEYETKGVDMSISSSLLATSRTDITAAQDAVAGVGSALTVALSATNPKEAMQPVRTAVKSAEDALRSAKDSLKKTLESVRAESQASSTATI